MKLLRSKAKGFTLVEAAVIILLLSIALIPVIKLISNKSGDNSAGGILTGASAGKLLSEEQAVANTIMEKAIAQDTSILHPLLANNNEILSFDENGNFVRLDQDGNYTATNYDPTADIATLGLESFGAAVSDTTARTFIYPRCRYQNTQFFYQWEVKDATMQEVWTDSSHTATEFKSFMPKGNNLIKAVLRIYSGADSKTKTTAQYSIATYFFKNTAKALAAGQQFTDMIGIVLVLDTSLSMRTANNVGEDTMSDFFEAPAPAPINGPLYVNMGAPYATGVPLPMRNSSGLYGYDPAAVAAPYLVYRPTKNDLFFSKTNDDPLTPYDERYNPCATAAPVAIDLQDLPAKTYSTSDVAANAALPSLAANCSAAMPTLPATIPSVLVQIPSMPYSTIVTNINTNSGLDLTVAGNEDDAFGSNCTDINNIQNTACPVYNVAGFEYDTNAVFPDMVALDKERTDLLRANLFGSTQDLNVIQATLSRIEAARTAMLSFVETIEGDPGLVANFRMGFVPFSTQVQDGTVAMQPNELLALQAPTGTSFTLLKEKLFRVNRACNFTGYNNYAYTGVTCPGNQKPINLTGNTNLAQALYYAQKQFQDYEAANPPLAKKIIILLTDGEPTKSATSFSNVVAMGTIAAEAANLNNISIALKNDDISIYTVGLLTAGNPDAGTALNAIKNGNSDNTLVIVNSVGDLTPVFENIAQQAARFALEQMKQRYSYLDYDVSN